MFKDFFKPFFPALSKKDDIIQISGKNILDKLKKKKTHLCYSSIWYDKINKQVLIKSSDGLIDRYDFPFKIIHGDSWCHFKFTQLSDKEFLLETSKPYINDVIKAELDFLGICYKNKKLNSDFYNSSTELYQYTIKEEDIGLIHLYFNSYLSYTNPAPVPPSRAFKSSVKSGSNNTTVGYNATRTSCVKSNKHKIKKNYLPLTSLKPTP